MLTVSLLPPLAPGAAPPPGRAIAGPCAPPERAAAAYRHVILIVLENHSYSDVAATSPYLNAPARRCGLASNYPALPHPSLPNYLALTSGTTAGVTDDCTNCRVRARSLFEQLKTRWRTYPE